MWKSKQCGMEMKPEASGQGRKRKNQDEVGKEMIPGALGQGKKPKYQDEGGTDLEFEEPSKARKRISQEQRDLELLSEQPSKDQIQKRGEESPRQLKPLEWAKGPQEQAVTGRKSADGGKGRKRPYCVMEEYDQHHQREKYQKLLQDLQHSDHVNSDPHRAHPTLMDILKIKGCVEGHSRGSRTTQCDLKQSTVVAATECLSPDKREKLCSEKSSDTQKKDGVNLEGRRGHHFKPDLLRAQTQVFLHSGSSRSLSNKMPVSIAKKELVTDQEKGRGMDEVLDVTEDMEKEIKNALGPGPQEEILSSAFKLQITRGDIQTLENGQWLNDEIINFYMNLLVERNENQGYPTLHVFSTFFYPKLKHGGYSSVKRWTRGMNLFEKEIVLVPIHRKVHWSLIVIDLRKQSIVYLDSMGQTGQNICETIFQYLQNESKTRRNIELDPLEWKQCSVTSEEIPQQLNGSDCGMFTCKYADYISRDQPVTFSQQHMPIFRKRMVWEILHSHLL
ncbi:LOW QUALITY PROTEIN: sentrin-specific protease 2-like [Phodopus roborovskii]|uniref:LOW QUALITY PROTEIN: sentrin-specific protease 2-like n=1 Tax=Phodopus roborovskii TaxID=109678 RepID=UPI0021E48ADD|nr:LOW QUALITY PROTEIN: sentrin-specific protease 2-like [Phodopus roborovskii]